MLCKVISDRPEWVHRLISSYTDFICLNTFYLWCTLFMYRCMLVVCVTFVIVCLFVLLSGDCWGRPCCSCNTHMLSTQGYHSFEFGMMCNRGEQWIWNSSVKFASRKAFQLVFVVSFVLPMFIACIFRLYVGLPSHIRAVKFPSSAHHG